MEEEAKQLCREKVIELLTPSEIQVFILFGRGKSLKEISLILGISPRTVANHRGNFMIKMSLKSSCQVMEYCIELDMDREEYVAKFSPEHDSEEE